ncbi:MAG: RNA degradosome polyphosphate kinase [Lachnospiraceae bacterium]|nr:RNA degradosome polyphosphate kinase [Lachnospiraceae bacterium]
MDYSKYEYYRNRELSWLAFDRRILGEARDKTNPLFERLKFLSITASNLDEFFMVRVGSLTDMLDAGYTKKDIAGMTVSEQLTAISEAAHELVEGQYNTLSGMLLPALAAQSITILTGHEAMTDEEIEFADRYFQNNIYPVLTPMAVDSSRPFPLILNKSLNIGAILENKDEGVIAAGKKEKSKKGKDDDAVFATVQVPSVLPRIIELPSHDGGRRFIFLEEIIERNLKKLFLNYEIRCSYPYRITRNADLSIDEEDADDLLLEIQKQIKKRQWGKAIRLEVEKSADKHFVKLLKKELGLEDESVYRISGPLDLTVMMKFYSMAGFEKFKSKPYTPQPSPQINPQLSIFENIKNGDILLHHPYEAFDPVVDFVRQAASDPDVLAIKQTLYRVSGNSPIIAALARAADNGKQVSVLVELKARFDEENNINWARMLEKSGCHVIYGLVGLKTHSKITLVVRREEDGIRRYVHLGTGNYNDATAKIYTDIGLLTCNPLIGEDATAVFNMLSGYSEPLAWNKLTLAPLWLRKSFYELIEIEKKHALEGRKAHIIAKVNSLSDKDIIAALYDAAAAGVKIDLIIRGICCLKTGIPGTNGNITVRSIVGEFLEHCRIFYFYNDGMEEIYCASADWMSRNLDRRVEIMFPVEKQELKDRLKEILDVQLKDNIKAAILLPDGSYVKPDGRGREQVMAQRFFCEEAVSKAVPYVNELAGRSFTPKMNPEL